MHKMTGVPAEDAQLILNNVREIACDFASQRSDRQRRRELMADDFDMLRESGYLLVAVQPRLAEFGMVRQLGLVCSVKFLNLLLTVIRP